MYNSGKPFSRASPCRANPAGSYAFSTSEAYSALVSATMFDNESGTDTYTSFAYGCFAAGSYSFQSMGSAESFTAAFSQGGTDSETDTGAGTNQSTGTSTTPSPDGYGGAAQSITVAVSASDSFQLTNQSYDSYSTAGTYASSAYQAGVQSFGAVNLSSLVSADSSSSASALSLTAQQSYTGTGNVSMSNIGSDHGSLASRSAYTFSSSDSVSLSASSAASASDYQAGVVTGGSLALSSLLLQDSSSDSQTYAQDGTFNASGNDSVAYAVDSYSFNQADNLNSLDTYHLSSAGTDSASDYQAGAYSNGSYAFASVLFFTGSSAAGTVHHYALMTAAGSVNSVSLATTTTSGSSVATTVVTQASGQQSYSSLFCATDDSASAAGASFSQAGAYANGSYAFSSLLQTDSGSSTDTYSVYLTQGRESYTALSTATTGASSLATDLWYTTIQYDTLNTFVSLDTFQLSGTAAASYSDYQAGLYANGSIAFTSVVQQAASSDSYHATESLSQLQTSVQNAQWHSLETTAYVASHSYQAISTASLLTTVSATETGTDSASTWQAGSYSSGSYAFASVAFTSSGSFAQTFDSVLSSTTPSSWSEVDTDTNPSNAWDNASLSVWGLNTQTEEDRATQSNAFALAEAGSYAAGSYAFSTLVHTATSAAASSYAVESYQSSTGTVVDWHENYVLRSLQTLSSSGSATASSSLYEAGVFGDGSWALSSLVEAQVTVAHDQLAYGGTTTRADGLNGYTTTDTALTTTVSDNVFQFFAAGVYAAGSYSFSSFAMTQSYAASPEADYTGEQIDSRTGRVTINNTGFYSYLLQEGGSGQAGSYTFTGWSSVSTVQDTYNLDGDLVDEETSSGGGSGALTGTFDLSGGQPYFGGDSFPEPMHPPAGGLEIVNVQATAGVSGGGEDASSAELASAAPAGSDSGGGLTGMGGEAAWADAVQGSHAADFPWHDFAEGLAAASGSGSTAAPTGAESASGLDPVMEDGSSSGSGGSGSGLTPNGRAAAAGDFAPMPPPPANSPQSRGMDYFPLGLGMVVGQRPAAGQGAPTDADQIDYNYYQLGTSPGSGPPTLDVATAGQVIGALGPVLGGMALLGPLLNQLPGIIGQAITDWYQSLPLFTRLQFEADLREALNNLPPPPALVISGPGLPSSVSAGSSEMAPAQGNPISAPAEPGFFNRPGYSVPTGNAQDDFDKRSATLAQMNAQTDVGSAPLRNVPGGGNADRSAAFSQAWADVGGGGGKIAVDTTLNGAQALPGYGGLVAFGLSLADDIAKGRKDQAIQRLTFLAIIGATLHTLGQGDAGLAPQKVVDYSGELRRDRGNATRSLRNALSTDSQIERPHHIIPWEAKDLPVVQAAARGGLNINGANNGVNLTLQVHPQGARHPLYNAAMMGQLDALGARNLTDPEAAAAVQAIADRLRPGLLRLNQSGVPLR